MQDNLSEGRNGVRERERERAGKCTSKWILWWLLEKKKVSSKRLRGGGGRTADGSLCHEHNLSKICYDFYQEYIIKILLYTLVFTKAHPA
jgi:hypothetical protein